MKMRKLLAVIAAVLAMTLVLAACSTNVDGKTFKFDSVSIEWTDNATEAEKAALVALVQSGSEDTITKDNVLDKFAEIVSKQAAENIPSFTFEDGKVKAGSAPATEYTQEGEKVTIGSGSPAPSEAKCATTNCAAPPKAANCIGMWLTCSARRICP